MKRISILILLISHSALGQFNNPAQIWGTSHIQRADMLYEQAFYEEAIVYYKKELEKLNFHEGTILKLAKCYDKLADYRMENSYYRILAQTSSIDNPEEMLEFAESLLSTGEYEEAIQWYNNYLNEKPGDQVAKNRLKGVMEIERFFQDSSNTEVSLFPYNSDQTEFGAVPFNDGILFTSAREKDLIIKHDNLRNAESLLDTYYLPPDKTTESDDPEINLERIKLNNHYKSNDGPIALGKQLIVFTRNTGKSKDDLYNPLGLEFYSFEGTSLKHLYSYPFNDRSYSIMHPSLSKSEDTLYFASDMPGGFGGIDIFYSVNRAGTWTQPVNAGTPVNTSADESFPFCESGKLYFSSNGHPGLGGLDIYVVDLNNADNLEVENLGFPINSGWDDFSIYVKNNQGYFSSNRPEGLGRDDIYKFEIIEKQEEEIIVNSQLKLSITDILNDERIDSAEVVLIDNQNNEEYTYRTADNGGLDQLLPPSYYTLQVLKSGYENYEAELDLFNVSLLVEEIYMKPSFSLESISLDSILFEYNDFKLSVGAEKELDEIISIMHKYDNLLLEVAAHTDSRGEKEYNHWLSEMRAASTANYLIEKGIDFNRVTINGYGETQLLNHCEDGIACSEKEHLVNRRIEFNFRTAEEQK